MQTRGSRRQGRWNEPKVRSQESGGREGLSPEERAKPPALAFGTRWSAGSWAAVPGASRHRLGCRCSELLVLWLVPWFGAAVVGRGCLRREEDPRGPTGRCLRHQRVLPAVYLTTFAAKTIQLHWSIYSFSCRATKLKNNNNSEAGPSQAMSQVIRKVSVRSVVGQRHGRSIAQAKQSPRIRG